jgi:hypothetical protein
MPRKKPLLPRPLDFNQTAFRLVRAATGEPVEDGPAEPNAAAAKLGRKGGRVGGNARAKSLSARKRRLIATKAAAARWARRKK